MMSFSIIMISISAVSAFICGDSYFELQLLNSNFGTTMGLLASKTCSTKFNSEEVQVSLRLLLFSQIQVKLV